MISSWRVNRQRKEEKEHFKIETKIKKMEKNPSQKKRVWKSPNLLKAAEIYVNWVS